MFFGERMKTPTQPKILLIVDDENLILKMLVRTLTPRFNKVFTASSPSEAEALLNENSITHLVCDCNLGPDLPLGIDLIPSWREMCPSITRAVVYSGTNLPTRTVSNDIDMIVAKSEGPGKLLTALQA